MLDDEQKVKKLVRQRRRRLERPSINGRIRELFNSDDEYYQLYDQLFEEQKGRCGICRKPWEGPWRFHMDHDHETLEIRGLLCFSCNSKLGWYEMFKRRIERYLR